MDEKKESSIDNNNEAQTPVKLKYPRSIAFIIGNEFCERFSYYGMKAILVLYFKNVLSYSEDSATEYYHIFAMACYFTPVLGAIIADSLLGKFRTIFYISILYAIGNIVLSYASYDQSRVVTWLGLTAIALGTGGIKPCVSAFGGDQFEPGQEKELQKFFSLFYISINAGSLLSTFITPILREDVHCFGREDCFPLAFGVPAILMIVALLLFLLGKFMTNYKIIPPQKGNIVVQVVSCVFTALGRKLFTRTPRRDHWLDYADDQCDSNTLQDIKAVMRVLFLYLPLPIFWALFDQQGSRWTLQATRMDGNFFGVYRLKPDQIQVVNPLLIICMIPVFEYGVYPLLAKINFLTKPLQKITTGGILAASAFVICAFFQFRIESDLPPEVKSNSAHLVIANGFNNSIEVKFLEYSTITIDSYGFHTLENVPINEIKDKPSFDVTVKNPNLCVAQNVSFNPNITDGALLFITGNICQTKETKISTYDFPDILKKPADGGANIGLVFNISGFEEFIRPNFTFRNEEFTHTLLPQNVSEGLGYVQYNELDIHRGGDYSLTLIANITANITTNITVHIDIAKDLTLKQGGSYLMVVNGDTTTLNYNMQEMVKPNTVSMFWQIIQYTVITAGEIMFSITGLEFSYSQSPKSMKAVLQAAWLMTVAFGNLIVAIIATAKIFDKQSYEFLFFAGLMVLDMMLFALMAKFYVPYVPNKTEEDNDKEKSQLNGNTNKEQNGTNGKKNGISNDGFKEEEDTKF